VPPTEIRFERLRVPAKQAFAGLYAAACGLHQSQTAMSSIGIGIYNHVWHGCHVIARLPRRPPGRERGYPDRSGWIRAGVTLSCATKIRHLVPANPDPDRWNTSLGPAIQL